MKAFGEIMLGNDYLSQVIWNVPRDHHFSLEVTCRGLRIASYSKGTSKPP
jgi:hypothetical protein